MIQHDHHCIMNVNWTPWRIQWVRGGLMGVGRDGRTKVAHLDKMDWVKYCNDAHAFLVGEQERIAARDDDLRRHRERRDARLRQEARELARRTIAHEQLLASGYGPIDELEDEVVLVDLEFTDVESIADVATEGRSTRSRLA
jgi:hypothetical protein